jgi:GNAT superfamily N-acetyltransferase
MVEIKPATTQSQYDAVSELTAEYIAWDADETAKLGLDPQIFIDFYYGHEPETLPGAFAPPAGCLLLATVDGLPAGCGGYLRFSEDICLLKRMYVRPEYRGKKIGRLMITELIQQARMSGYRTIRLETASYMGEAHRLYQSFGFKFRPPYYEIPESLLESTYFMELQFNESGE